MGLRGNVGSTAFWGIRDGFVFPEWVNVVFIWNRRRRALDLLHRICRRCPDRMLAVPTRHGNGMLAECLEGSPCTAVWLGEGIGELGNRGSVYGLSVDIFVFPVFPENEMNSLFPGWCWIPVGSKGEVPLVLPLWFPFPQGASASAYSERMMPPPFSCGIIRPCRRMLVGRELPIGLAAVPARRLRAGTATCVPCVRHLE